MDLQKPKKAVRSNLSRDFHRYLVPTSPDYYSTLIPNFAAKSSVDFYIDPENFRENCESIERRKKRLKAERKKLVKTCKIEKNSQLSFTPRNKSRPEADSLKENLELLNLLFENSQIEVIEQNLMQTELQFKLQTMSDLVQILSLKLDESINRSV